MFFTIGPPTVAPNSLRLNAGFGRPVAKKSFAAKARLRLNSKRVNLKSFVPLLVMIEMAAEPSCSALALLVSILKSWIVSTEGVVESAVWKEYAAPPLPRSLNATPSIEKKLPPQCREPASFGFDGLSEVLPGVIRISRSSVRPLSGSVTTVWLSTLFASDDDSEATTGAAASTEMVCCRSPGSMRTSLRIVWLVSSVTDLTSTLRKPLLSTRML